jgi:multidrug resistance efflux pump
MWTRILIWTLGMGTVLLLVWSWFTRIDETVSMDGAIETASPEAKVTSANEGQIEAVLIHPDQVVRKGDLLFRLSTQDVDVTISGLKAKLVEFKAKDIFRASQLSLLGVSNSHVKLTRKKIRKSIHLSPLLLVRDPGNGKVVIADGYHRLCAIYQTHEDIWIRCKIV